MGLFDKIKEPVFLKEEGSLSSQLQSLEELLKNASLNDRKRIEQDIRNIRAGITGERQVAFELKNSHMPMYVLHDIHLEYEGLTAQIDYIVITRRRNFVIECKNLYGNIEITSQGDFIRHTDYQGNLSQERIYSPITQNERHLALIKQIRTAERTNILTQRFFEKFFNMNYRSVVVLANSKTVLDGDKAQGEIIEQVVPVDRLIAHIKKVNSENDAVNCSEKDMMALAHFFLSINKEAPDYIAKYSKRVYGGYSQVQGQSDTTVQELPRIALKPTISPYFIKAPSVIQPNPVEEKCPILCPMCGGEMVLRTAKKGDNIGSHFYGCSNFPKCRNVVQLEALKKGD